MCSCALYRRKFPMRKRGAKHGSYLSAQEASEKERTRLQKAYENRKRQKGFEEKTPEGQSQTHLLIAVRFHSAKEKLSRIFRAALVSKMQNRVSDLRHTRFVGTCRAPFFAEHPRFAPPRTAGVRTFKKCKTCKTETERNGHA